MTDSSCPSVIESCLSYREFSYNSKMTDKWQGWD